MQELQHFEIEGSYGGNQDWMHNPWMKLGGCAALAAVDTCIYLTMFKGAEGICPDGTFPLTKNSYNEFAESIRPYLAPRFRGVNKLSLYTAGFSAYLRDCGFDNLSMEALPMGTAAETAMEALKDRIDAGFLVPILHLVPKTASVKEYHWHWFLLNAYREAEDGFQVRAVTYSEWEWLKFEDLWDEDDSKNGGLILYFDRQAPVSLHTAYAAAAIICDRAELPARVFAKACTDNRYTGCFEFPWTETTHDEAPEELLRRVVREENGADVRVVKRMAVSEEKEADYNLTTDCYMLVPEDGSALIAGKETEGRWLTRDELHTVQWTPACRKLADIIYAEMTDASTFRP